MKTEVYIAKTSKQKCLDMWQKFASNPEMDKYAYKDFLDSLGLVSEYAACWACEETGDYGCKRCPVTWGTYRGEFEMGCCFPGSPYHTWEKEKQKSKPNPKIIRKAALDIVKLIETTWED